MIFVGSDTMQSKEKISYIQNIKNISSKVFYIVFMINVLAVVIVFFTNSIIEVFLNTNEKLINPQLLKFFQIYFPCILSEIILIIVSFKMLKNDIDKTWLSFSKRLDFTTIQNPKKFVILSVFGVFGITFTVIVISNIENIILSNLGYKIIVPDTEFTGDNIALILGTIYPCLIAPVLEEIIFRGFVLNALKKYGLVTAIIASSIAFAMFHMNPLQIPVGLMTGLLLGYVAVKTNSIKLAIIIHIVNNALNVLPTLFLNDSDATLFTLIIVIIGIILLIGFIVSYKNDIKNLSKYEDCTILSKSKKIAHIYISVSAILFITQFIVNNILFFMTNLKKL